MNVRQRFVFVTIAIFATPAFADSPMELTRERDVQAAEASIDKLAQQGFAGSVLVARGADVIYARTIPAAVPPTDVPSYWIASITKQFVATGILLLHEEKRLDIYQPLTSYLADVPKDKRDITLFHLLTHTSGLTQRYAADGIAERDRARKALLAGKLKSAPGSKFAYANDNYNLLAIVLEKQSGLAYEEFLRTRIFQPAGMVNAGSWSMPVEQGSYVPPVATPPLKSNRGANWGFRGATGMRASVQDLFAFVRALHDDKLLTANSRELLMGNHLQLDSGTQIGFNWFTQRTPTGVYRKFSRGQESFGGNAVIYCYPDQGLTIITATNAGPAESGDGSVVGWSRRTHDALARIFVKTEGAAPSAVPESGR